jgi:sulfite dehydrogenase (cytochrome) subunit B
MKTTAKNVGTLAALATVVAIALAGPTARAAEKSMTLPPDGLQLEPSALPGYAKAKAECVACHSAEYMAYQPPTAPRTYWDAMVTRMKTVFKAPIGDVDQPLIVDYLVKTYGNERPH